MKIYDTHAHLDQLEDLEEALKEAARSGVVGIVAPAMNLESCQKLLDIKTRTGEPRVYIGMGMHPAEADAGDLDRIVQMIHDNKEQLHLIGEIGLDYWYKWVRKDDAKKEEQRRIYRRFLELAKELDLPAVIHSRGAWKDCLAIAREVGTEKAEFHWYSGPLDVLEEILEEGYYVSTSPSIAYSSPLREAMSRAPIERTLIETDCPVYYRNRDTGEGFQAQPKDVLRTLKAYSDLKNLDEEEAVSILNENAKAFFNLN